MFGRDPFRMTPPDHGSPDDALAWVAFFVAVTLICVILPRFA